MKNKWLLFVIAGLVAVPLKAEVYSIDPAHSGITFRVSHLVISKVTGRFDKFDGSLEYEKGKPKTWKTEATIDAASINTKIEDRDKHLRSPEFLDVEKYPQITFKSTKISEIKNNKAKLYGELTIHGVTKEVALDLEIGGEVKDPWGNQRFGAIATTTINRKDFGLTWNKVLETGGLVVGEDIEITLEIEGIAKKA